MSWAHLWQNLLVSPQKSLKIIIKSTFLQDVSSLFPTGVPVQPGGAPQCDQGPGGLCAAGQGRSHTHLTARIPAQRPGAQFNTTTIINKLS